MHMRRLRGVLIMADNTKIEWADATINAINGCSLASPGCTNCYAMKQAHRFPIRQGLTEKSKGGMVWTGEVRLAEEQLIKPLAWKRPRRIFWNAHGDTFHPSVPDSWIDQVFATAAATPQHIHMIVTKRSDRMRDYLRRLPERVKTLAADPGLDFANLPLPNVWLGVSVEDQTRADERIPDLLATPAAVRFISAEPLLGPVDLTRISLGEFVGTGWYEGQIIHGLANSLRWPRPPFASIDWVIVGGESGPGARPMHLDWARSLRDQCAAAGVPFHFKQWGQWKPFSGWVDGVSSYSDASGTYKADQIYRFPDGNYAAKVGKRAAGRLLDGVEHNGMPA